MKNHHPNSQSKSFKKLDRTHCDQGKVHIKYFVSGRITRTLLGYEECEYHEKFLRYSCAYYKYASFNRNTVRHHLKRTHYSQKSYIKRIGCIKCKTESNYPHTAERRAIKQISGQNCNLGNNLGLSWTKIVRNQ